MLLRVRDKRNGNIRTITHLAYAAMGEKVYEKLGQVDETYTSPAPTPEPVKVEATHVHRSVSAPVIRPQIVETKQAPEPEAEAVTENVATEATPVKVKGKPGRKPKSISSDADASEK